MAPKLYWILASPPARAVVFCAKQLGIELDLIEVDILKNEQYKPEFLKINPLHTVPVLDDDGFIITDSHAIMPYLVSKYRKGNPLYPEDIKKRAMVDQRLHFDSGTLFANHIRVCMPLLNKRTKAIPEDILTALTEAYCVLEGFLLDSKYVAGEDLTIADLSIWTTITNCSGYHPVEKNKYPKIAAWLKRMEATPCNDLNKAAGDYIRDLFQSLLS